MTSPGERASWVTPSKVDVSPVPAINSSAPTTSKLPFPNPSGNPTVIAFLRHCGCPFAEKTFLDLRKLADEHKNIDFVAVSHSNQEHTDTWVKSVGGSNGIQVIVDAERTLYGKWGLGVSSTWHVLNPFSLWNVFNLGKKEKIWNRLTESGSRWQTSGAFAVDKSGIVKWARPAPAADDIPDFQQALKSLKL